VQHGLARITLDKVQNIEIIWAEFDEPLYLEQKRMLDNKYSQLPVRRNDQIVGSLTERGINRVLMANTGTDQKDLLVRDAIEEGFPLVPASATVSSVASLLQAYQAILTSSGGKVIGIVTNADLLKLFGLH
jgi:predicted transcriptional regulator